MSNKNEIAVIGTPKLPKALKDRLMNKILDKNDDKIIAAMEQRQSHIEAIKRIDKEIADLTSIHGIE